MYSGILWAPREGMVVTSGWGPCGDVKRRTKSGTRRGALTIALRQVTDQEWSGMLGWSWVVEVDVVSIRLLPLGGVEVLGAWWCIVSTSTDSV